MSDSPRTDAEDFRFGYTNGIDKQTDAYRELARQLERDLTAAQQELDAIRNDHCPCDKYANALRYQTQRADKAEAHINSVRRFVKDRQFRPISRHFRTA